MNRNLASAANVAQTWSRSPMTLANSWTWSLGASSCTATFIPVYKPTLPDSEGGAELARRHRDGGLAAVGLLAWVAVCKYLDHLPLYRIKQIAARQGVPLARSTPGEWIQCARRRAVDGRVRQSDQPRWCACARFPQKLARPSDGRRLLGLALFTAGPTGLACLAHIRRKFFDVHAASGSSMAEEALRRIAQF